MGKGKTKKNTNTLISKPTSLVDQLTASDKSVRKEPHQKKRRREEDEDGCVKQREMKKIMKLAFEQIAEGKDDEIKPSTSSTPAPAMRQMNITSDDESNDDKPDDERDSDDDDDDDGDDGDDDDGVHCEDQAENERTREEFEAFANLMKEDELVDHFVDAVSTRKSEICSQLSDANSIITKLSPDAIRVFKTVGQLMKHHTHGPTPKPFKVIPSYKNWDELLELTNPDEWSAAGVFAATRLLVANLTHDEFAKYVNRVLLPRIRDDLRQYQKLNKHLYDALIKCTWKSYGFIRGFLLPLCKAGDCNLNEASKIGSALKRASMKPIYVALAISEICKLQYNPANCVFITELLAKRTSLPFKALNELVDFFLTFRREPQQTERWHLCLKVFVEIYVDNLSTEQKEALLDLLKTKNTTKFTFNIRESLQVSIAKELKKPEKMSS